MKMWSVIKKRNPVWYLDATGSVIQEVNGQNSPFLYSIAMHDIEAKNILPISEFITTSNSSDTISRYLFTIKNVDKIFRKEK